MSERAPVVGIIMGSKSDWAVMEHASRTLTELDVPHEKRIISAHRTPELVHEYAAAARGRRIRAIIAGAGGAAHLPGMLEASADWIPVYGVPIPSTVLQGMDSLLSIVQMPRGVPVHTMAIGEPGAVNAALAAAEHLAAGDPVVLEALRAFRRRLREKVEQDDREIQGL